MGLQRIGTDLHRYVCGVYPAFIVGTLALMLHTTLADEAASPKHYHHGGIVINGSATKLIIWRSNDAADRIAKMESAGIEVTERDIEQAAACLVASGTAVSWLETNNSFPPTMTVIVREGPATGCTGIVSRDEFEPDKP
jgi:hypothetical protein